MHQGAVASGFEKRALHPRAPHDVEDIVLQRIRIVEVSAAEAQHLVIHSKIECRAAVSNFGNKYHVPYDSPFQKHHRPKSTSTSGVLELVCSISTGDAGR